MTEPLPVSWHLAKRLRDIRNARSITGDQLAEGLQANGFVTSRSMIANYENGRFRAAPVDLAVAAMKFFDVSFPGLMRGPLCHVCGDDPPSAFICKTCRRTRNSAGELVQC